VFIAFAHGLNPLGAAFSIVRVVKVRGLWEALGLLSWFVASLIALIRPCFFIGCLCAGILAPSCLSPAHGFDPPNLHCWVVCV
jgi:hypothetical protein